MQTHDIDTVATGASASAASASAARGRRHTIFGGLLAASLVVLTLGTSVAAASPPPAPTDEAGVAAVGGTVVLGAVIAPEKVDAAFKAYAACMREHGIDMPDPVIIEAMDTIGTTTISGVVSAPSTSESSAPDPASAEFIAADAACSPILNDAGVLAAATTAASGADGSLSVASGVGAIGALPDAGATVIGGSPVDVEKMNAALTRYAACMREHGIDMPDPITIQVSSAIDATAPTAGVVTVTGAARALSLDPTSQTFAAADAACAPVLADAGMAPPVPATGVSEVAPAGE